MDMVFEPKPKRKSRRRPYRIEYQDKDGAWQFVRFMDRKDAAVAMLYKLAPIYRGDPIRLWDRVNKVVVDQIDP